MAAMRLPTLFIAGFALTFFTEVSAQSNLETTQLCVGDHAQVITAEVADTLTTRARGLMQRESLQPHHGMLFRYDSVRPGHNGFWMYQTLIPLDIAFIDSNHRIVRIMQMQPCTSIDPANCPSYRPGKEYQSALEMDFGYFQDVGIAVGDTLREAKNGSCAGTE
ncbi:hypothetical protein SAMN06297229_1126 [Pseudidiomarina planktonica]|uniref:DUF192 domain-containing protein n=1 Tax=Pseudidiomarina planktonica TaxID=1323738 RepID=A0A1Y6ERH7_9GAMM|nr:DUF192 domain-containing protein [Pseudidiomarina planktonica]RUO65465.1 DUF192 domain-containing protein [Pseudidiomarina planktonica]SMQ64879.1 hypothetical protein SAMN06297229_1126 [Pseudidiomarina planktonica]